MSKDSIEVSVRDQAKQVRAKCPSAYALTVNEAVRISRIDMIIWQFFTTHREFVQEQDTGSVSRDGQPIKRYARVFNDDSVRMILEQLSRHRISIDNAHALAKRVLSGHWFDIIGVLNLSGDPDRAVMALYVDGEDRGIIPRDAFPTFYEVYLAEGYSNAEALRQALGLDDNCLMLLSGEREYLSLINVIAEHTSTPVTVYSPDGYMPITNSPETTSIIAVGSKALKNADYDDVNERYNIVTASGDYIYLKGQRLLTVSSEWVNIDKLLRQINYKSYQDSHNSKEVVITLDEFMELRGLSDRKEARKQFGKVIDDLYHLSCKTKSKFGEVRYVQNKPEIKNSQASFILSDLYHAALIYYSSISLVPTSFMRIDGRGSNAYKIAVYLSDHKRKNLNRPNENKVSIGTLLEITSLPEASRIKPNHYKQQIIDPFFAALNTAKNTGEFTYTLSIKGSDTCNEVEAHYDYYYFIRCTVNVQWLKEPDYTSLRERKAKEAEAAERGRLKGIEAAAKKKAEGQAKDKPVKKK